MIPAISVDGLSKRYRLGPRRTYRTLRETIAEKVRLPFSGRGAPHSRSGDSGSADDERSFWVLKDVSFEIEPGEVVGVIGRNGAGKSTLLKILSRITEPTAGRVQLHGRIGSLLEVGTGFHPELTGRENIYLNGAILGMQRQEITSKFDDIVAFAEVERFLDTPVKHYSSGMYVRLAFAVAAHLEPEILLVDEVLAVGDMPFQKRCLGKMGEVARSGRTVLLVSHNMASILNLCKKVLVIDHGHLQHAGNTDEGVELYMRSCVTPGGGQVDLATHPNRRRGSTAVLRRAMLRNPTGAITDQFGCGDPVTIELLVDAPAPLSEFNFQIGLDDALGTRLFTVATNFSEAGWLRLENGLQRVVCELDQLPLAPGQYSLSFFVGPLYKPVLDAVEHGISLEVLPTDFYGSGRMPHPTQGRFLVRSRWATGAAALTTPQP
jgi:lipopolysaccharide transport system ATP-binding protein